MQHPPTGAVPASIVLAAVETTTGQRLMRCSANEYAQRVRETRWTETAEDHIAAHAVSPDEVEQVVNTRPRLLLAGREGTQYVFGTTSAGRYLLVVLTEAIDGRDYVVTAREMTDAERQTFRREGR